MDATTTRLTGVDLLKGIASQAIVLHHLSAYGPLSDAAAQVAPALATWLYEYGRMAVQVFLVAGGFLAARGLDPGLRGPGPAPGDAARGAVRDVAALPLALLGRRWRRLALPLLAALALAVGAAALARTVLEDDWIPAAPDVAQVVAHALLLQDVLGYPSLSAGAWYVAVDFQLFALTALLLWVGRTPLAGRLLVLSLAAASLLCFNRDARWDAWGLYFLGSYGLGLAAWWSAGRARSAAWMAGMTAVALVSLALDFRLRIALALAVALGLAAGHRTGVLDRLPRTRTGAFLSRISYALFLVHFPVLMLANAAYAGLGAASPALAVALLAATWAASLALATLFHRLVENW